MSRVPHNLEAEASVLSCILMDAGRALPPCLAVLSSSDFFSPKHRAIWESMLRLVNRSEPVDMLTLEGDLRQSGTLFTAGGIEYLAEISGVVPTVENVAHHARLVRAESVRRDLMELGDTLTRKAREGAPEGLIQGAVEQLKDLLSTEQGGMTADQVAKDVLRGWEDRRDGGTMPGVPTSMDTLNNALEAGGWPRGVLFVVAGETSMGKTSLMVGEALHAALAGQRVDYVGLEDQAPRIFKRMVAQRARLQNKRLQGAGPRSAEWQTAFDALAEIANLKDSLHFWSKRDGDARTLAAKILAKQRTKGTDVVFWDYLQKTRGGRGKSDYERIKDTLEVIDDLAAEMPDTALVLGSQFKRRQDLTSPPGLQDLKGAGEIENESRSVLIIWTHPDLLEEPFRLFRLAKQSEGGRADVYVRWTAENVRFEDAGHVEESGYRERLREAVGR